MSSPTESQRLRATLGHPSLARLLDALARRLELGRTLTGRLTLARATAVERTALDELLGRKPTRGDTLLVDLDLLAETLVAARLCRSLPDAVAALRGPVRNRRAEAEALAATWAAVRSDAHRRFRPWPQLADWIEKVLSSGVLKRLAADPAQAVALLAELERVVRALPCRAEPLAAFAARLFGDAHALDAGSPRGTLAVQAAAQLGRIAADDHAEGRRSAWASVGVLSDELSAPVLTFGLPVAGTTPLARLIRSASADAEPLHLSLRLLLRHPLSSDAGLAAANIFVCENPTVIAQAINSLGPACAPLVCVNGQFATPALILLRQLRDAGSRLHYHGDFDGGGLAIARRVFAECGAKPWRFSVEDYDRAPKGKALSGAVGPTPWSPALAGRMDRTGRAVHEEAVALELIADLARTDD